MVVFNYTSRELTTKVVYYGPGLCGKTTNLQFIYESMPQGVRGKMLSLATTGDRTLFFDFLPLDLGQIQGMTTKVQLYTVPGQVFYNETRRLVLKGADGIVFVADSQEKMLEANLDSFRNLEENLRGHGMDPSDTPLVLQFNKRDLPDAMDVDQLNEALNRYNAPFYEAIATTGVGVQETLRHITKLVLLKLNERYAEGRAGASGRVADPPMPEAGQQEAATPEAPIALDASADEAPLPMGDASPGPASDPDFDIAPSAPAETPEPAGEPAMPSFEAPHAPPLETPEPDEEPALQPAASAQQDIPTIAAPISPDAGVQDLDPPSGPPPGTEPDAKRASATATLVAADADDVLGRPEDLARAVASPAEDEDVLGVAPAVSEPASDAARDPAAEPAVPPAGTTVKIDRESLSDLIDKEVSGVQDSGAPSGALRSEVAGPGARASISEVSAEDAVFNEPGVEPTRLAPGQPQEILIPVEIEEGGRTRRFRLTLYLELDS